MTPIPATVHRAAFKARYEARRVAQTRRTFENWTELLARMGRERVGRDTDDRLEFVTRTGVRMSCPNVPGARLPMYEQFAEDCYSREWVAGTGSRAGALRVLDVGAHVGAFAVNLASLRPGIEIDCYEPAPDSARFLRENVDRNGLADRVHVHEAAMAGTAGTALLDDNAAGSVHNGLVRDDQRLVRGGDSLDRRGTHTVTATTFDAAVAAAGGRFDVVKMDCEGGEYELVYASDPANWAPVQRVVMEYHPVAGESWTQLRSWFESAGLRLVRHHSDAAGLGTAWLQREAS